MRPLLLCLLASPALSGDVWTVDDDGPADFATVQEAVDAAAEGDTILVQPGTYLEFMVLGKGLTIVGVGATRPWADGASVRSTAPQSRVVLSNLALSYGSLVVAHTQGPVWIRSCEVYPYFYHALEARNAAQVFLHDCVLVGALGDSMLWGDGQDGLRVWDGSQVSVTASSITGGDGIQNMYGHVGEGGRGLLSGGQTVFVAGSTLVGGVDVNALRWEALISYQGGDFALANSYSGPVRGDLTTLDGGARRLDGPVLATEGDTITLTVAGTARETVGLLVSDDPIHVLAPTLGGTLGVPWHPLSRVSAIGTIPLSGSLAHGWTVPDVAGAGQARTLYLQALVRRADGSLRLTNPLGLAVLGS